MRCQEVLVERSGVMTEHVIGWVVCRGQGAKEVPRALLGSVQGCLHHATGALPGRTWLSLRKGYSTLPCRRQGEAGLELWCCKSC